MTAYQFISKKLQKFTVTEFAMVKWIYIVLGFLITSLYEPLSYLSVWVYIVLGIVTAMPLLLLTFGFDGNLIKKAKQYLKNNNPSNQVLTLISCVSFGIAAAVFFPILAGYTWWVYVVVMGALLIKPFHHVFLTK